MAQVQEEALAAEDAKADGLAVLGGHNGDAQVVFFIAGFHGDAPVMGQAFFGDVQAGHDFEPRDHRRMEEAHVGGQRDGFEHAVHAVAQADRVGVRLDMDVGRLEPQGFLEELVDEGGDGGLEGGVGFLALEVEDDFLVEFAGAAFLAEFLNGLGPEAEVFFGDGMDRAGGGQDGPEAFAQDQAQGLLDLARRFAEGQDQAIGLDAHRAAGGSGG